MNSPDYEFLPLQQTADIDAAVNLWRSILAENAPDDEARISTPGVWTEFQRKPHHDGHGQQNRWFIDIGLPGQGTVASINIPAERFDQNVLGAIACDTDGHRWVLRQGRLHEKLGGDKRILDDAFRELSSLEPVRLHGATRNYYRVADLDGDSEAARVSTANFAATCDMVRQRALARMNAPQAVLEAVSAERTLQHKIKELDPFEKPMTRTASAREETTIRSLHPDIQIALVDALFRINLQPIRIERRFRTDLLVPLESRSVLFEVKASASANEIHTGVGQLFIYREIFKERGEIAPVLVLPHASAQISAVLTALGISVLTYGNAGCPNFEPEALRLFLAALPRSACQTA